MQNLRRLLRMPLVKIFTGEQIDEVQEVIVNIDKAVICGVQLSDRHQGIAFSDLIIGPDTILIRSTENIVDSKVLFSGAIVSTELYDKQIYTDTGVIIGILADILFDSVTGEIKCYEVSDSFLGDLLDGRKVMPFPTVQVLGQDKIIVPQSMEKLLL